MFLFKGVTCSYRMDLGHEERTQLALAVNDLVAEGVLSAPVAFTRDRLDAGAMAHLIL